MTEEDSHGSECDSDDDTPVTKEMTDKVDKLLSATINYANKALLDTENGLKLITEAILLTCKVLNQMDRTNNNLTKEHEGYVKKHNEKERELKKEVCRLQKRERQRKMEFEKLKRGNAAKGKNLIRLGTRLVRMKRRVHEMEH